eukprot:424010-Alexandrium_andersonii.AAC.1
MAMRAPAERPVRPRAESVGSSYRRPRPPRGARSGQSCPPTARGTSRRALRPRRSAPPASPPSQLRERPPASAPPSPVSQAAAPPSTGDERAREVCMAPAEVPGWAPTAGAKSPGPPATPPECPNELRRLHALCARYELRGEGARGGPSLPGFTAGRRPSA